ncbi:uncharacterized protein si:ch211-269k10.4 [Mugil cephalus]|uniref:uncharacterized protein si:ch211-269k10.4 n=1 Tax=Mugil cephalus TaxID=48193 RepID=UPI001FB7D4F7|nr:uncharacterized protein si:ch211-269k10.4 [Mugil cephalus]
MACADIDMDILSDEEPLRGDKRETTIARHYQATEMIPENKGPLHELLKKQPAVLGSLQIVSGILSVGVGILFSVTLEMKTTLLTLFRVAHLTGGLFIIAGLISNLLFKYPALLTVSLAVNSGCIVVAVIGAILISVDLAKFEQGNEPWRMELLELCVLGLETFLSAVLCFWFFKEKAAKSK